MAQEQVNGFVIAQDSVHGVPMWKVRIRHQGHEYDGRKCRVMSVHGGYTPNQSDTVTFIVGSTRDSGRDVLVAYDVSPQTNARVSEPVSTTPERDTMDWVITRLDGELHVGCVGDVGVFRQDLENCDEEFVAFIPFDISEHSTQWSDPDIKGGFELVRALACTTPTLQALERLVTAIVREAVKKV